MISLDALINEKGPSISIIISTVESWEKKNYEALKKVVQRAKGILINKSYPEKIKTALSFKLDEAVRVLPHTILQGVGIFVSTGQSAVIPFPFPVHQKIKVDAGFETRELFYLRQYCAPYYVLCLSNREVRLYSGIMDTLKEIKDGNFPALVDDQYEYLLPPLESPTGSSVNTTNKNKGNLSALHIKTMLKDSDVHLEPYLATDDAKVILAGTQKIINAFLALTRFSKKIVGKVPGSVSNMNFDMLEKSAWLTYMHHKKQEDEQYILKLIENDIGLITDGLRDAWKDAQVGKGQLLAVEKDYHCQGYQLPDHDDLLLQPPPKPYTAIPDAVNVLIETVNKKNGKIMFMDNGQLKNLGHVVLWSHH